MMKDLSIYIHIPFCKEKCYYCDFLSFKGKDDYFRAYQNALLKEIISFANENKNIYEIKTIFIGGGTPSVLPIGFIGEIMQTIFENFKVSELAEITIEANPGVLSYELIKHFKNSNINRISLGVQSLKNDILKNIGRLHTAEQFYENFNNIRKADFNNVNVDLMFSLPNQSLYDFEETLLKILNFEPEHISCYSLILEENTKFYSMYESGLLEPVEDELDREFYYKAINILEKNDYNFYEISNFSKKNKECKHNIVYWERKEYVGFGLGASSLLNETRITNTKKFNEYINFKNDKFIEILNKNDIYSEFVFLGLRMTQGISKSKFKKNFGIELKEIYAKEIEKFLKNGLLIENGDFIHLSKKGIDLSNTVFLEFI